MGQVETVRIKHPKLGSVIINKSDFQQGVHELFVESRPQEVKPVTALKEEVHQEPVKTPEPVADGSTDGANSNETKVETQDQTGDNKDAVDTTPGDISTVTADIARDLIDAVADLETLVTLEAAERASVKNPGGRKGVLDRIESRRKALTKE